MKNVQLGALLALLTFVVACSNVDPAVVQQIEENTTAIEKAKPAADSLVKGLEDFKAKMSAVPEASKNTADFVVGQFTQKYNAMMAEYNATQAELKQLKDDYAAGKITKEVLEPKLEVLKNKAENFEKAFQRYQNRMNMDQAQLLQMGEEIAKGMGVDLSKPVSSDVSGAGEPNVTPSDAQRPAPDGQQLTAPDGVQKKKGN